MESSEEIVTQIKKTSQSVFTELAILIALKKIGEKKGLTLLQQSDFHTPWGKVPDSEEEEAHQDLVWIHKVLPPNDKFDLVKAQEGFYKNLRSKLLEEFWFDNPFEKISSRRIYKEIKSPLFKSRNVKPPIRRCKKEVKHDL
tara:strand:- start:21 stop:446 length:426 start_codon:yes stop_codon:yes gene_type:complete